MKCITTAAAVLLLATAAQAEQASPQVQQSSPPGNAGSSLGTRGPGDPGAMRAEESNRASRDRTAQTTQGQMGTQGTQSQKGTEGQMRDSDRMGSSERFRQTQGPDQWLVANLWNKNVYNSSGESIGNLNDLVIDKDGRIAAVVVGVGGFLGLGEKNVAVDYNHLKQNGGISPDRVTLNMSKEDLSNAPSFQRHGSSSGGIMGGNTSR
jgi:sporulation protein YlmC with PRC-barrel domain